MSKVIKMNQIYFSYGDELLFNNLSLEVEQGDFIALIGPNGAGKSTILKMLTHLVEPTSGSISLFGVDVKKFKDWHKVGYVPQNPGKQHKAFPVTVEEVVNMGRIRPVPFFQRTSDEDLYAVRKNLELVGMWDYRNRLIGELSGGQQQRVFVAKALASNPGLLILDEPATGIDVEAKKNLYALLASLNEQMGISIIMVSHDVEMAIGAAKHVLCVDRGVCFWGAGEDVLKHNKIHGIMYESRRMH